MTTISFKPGMREHLTLFTDSPDAGDPTCVCSYCGELVEEDEMPLRIFIPESEKYPRGAEYRLHVGCAGQVVQWQGEHDESLDLNDGVIEDAFGDEDDAPDQFGPCCACECEGTRENPVRNILLLHKKTPVPGTGWGCVICKLPFDGASAVVCDRCLEAHAELRLAVSGYLHEKKRVKIEELQGEHKHNLEVDHG